MKAKIARRYIERNKHRITAGDVPLSDSIYYTRCINKLKTCKNNILPTKENKGIWITQNK